MRPTTPWTWLDGARSIARTDWPPARPAHREGSVALVHRGRHWALWADGSVTSTVSLAPAQNLPVGELRPDAVDLIDAVWHSNGHHGFDRWEVLARVERVLERETLGVRWPRPWEERLDRLVVESVDGAVSSLFVHATLPEERPSAARVMVSTTLPEALAGGLDRPEPYLLYDLGSPLHGTPKVPASAPGYILVRPESRCATAFHPVRRRDGGTGSYTRHDHPSLRAAMAAHALHPNQVRPVWPALHAVALPTVAAIEALRWGVKATVEATAGGLMLRIDGELYGPCGTPWDLASILAARSVARRKSPVRNRGTATVRETEAVPVKRGRATARR